MEVVDIQHYPQLRQLCWNRPGITEISRCDAFSLYERNWRHIDTSSLLEIERALIEQLTVEYGNGFFLG